MESMPKKQPRIRKKTPAASGKEVAVSLLKVVRDFTLKDGSKCEGMVSVSPKNQTPVACSFASYPNGDYVVWFNDSFKWHLYALVNERLKHIVTVEDGEIETLLKHCRDLDKQITDNLD